MFNYTHFKQRRLELHLSEEELASRAHLSRLTLRAIESGKGNPTWSSLEMLAKELGFSLELSLYSVDEKNIASEDSVLGSSLLIHYEGFDTWPVYLMNFVDAYRKNIDPRLISLPPFSKSEKRISALFASTVLSLCEEKKSVIPNWAKKEYFLDEPWFPSESESLKASALLESPVYYKKNNIFVLDNFLKRA